MKKTLIAVALLALSSTSAFAVEKTNIYAGADVGYGSISEDSVSGGSLTGRAYVGYDINQYVSAEVGAFKSADASVKNTPVDVSAQGVDISAVVRPFTTKSLLKNLYGRVGAHYSEVEGSAGVYSASKTGAGLLVGVGYENQLTDKVSGRIGYTFYSDVGGITDVNLVTAGLKYSF